MIYTYECEECAKRYEIDMKLKDIGQKIPCPHCKKKLTKILTPVYFRIN